MGTLRCWMGGGLVSCLVLIDFDGVRDEGGEETQPLIVGIDR